MQEPSAEEYARDHLKFLEEERPDVLEGLRRSGDLNSYLSSVGEQAEEMFDDLMRQYLHSPHVQSLPHLKQVRALQSRRHEADEVVRHDLIYQPLKEDETQS